MTIDTRPRRVQATVYMPNKFHEKAIVYAKQRFTEVLQPNEGVSEDECLARAEGILLRVGSMPRDKLLKTRCLRAIARNGTGVDSIHKPTALEKEVIVMNCPGGNAQAVAELVLAFALSLLRRIPEISRRIRDGEVIPSINALAPGLRGKTVGLVGMGDIAQQVVALFQPFGCRFLVYSPTSDKARWTSAHLTDPAIAHTRHDSLDTLLPEVDILTLHCPALPSTHHMIGARELALMRPGAILINTARGGIVDETALEDALESGRLGGAGLDVFEEEPLRAERYRGLIDRDNVIALPHLGGSTDEATLKGCLQAIEQLADYLDGKPARNRVY